MTYRFSDRMSRRWFLAAFTASIAGLAQANAPARSLRPTARPGGLVPREKPSEALVQASGVSGIVGFSVLDVRTGQVLEERASTAALPPASVAKAITALYALDTLGTGHRFATRVLVTGQVSAGVVSGDLILAGGGDPTLGTEDLAVLARKLKDAGVREVRGRFRVYGGALPYARVIDAEQPEHVGYNPSVSGLNLNFNRVHFEWKRQSGAWKITMDARSRNYRPDVQMAKMAVAQRDVPIYSYSDAGGRDNWTVASGALGNGGARWLPVRKPELYAGEVFQTFARAQGIVLKAPDVVKRLPSAREVARVQSAPLDELVRGMLKFSTNLTAEVLGMAATAKRKGQAASLKASAREMSSWAQQRLGMGRAAKFVDHSGLGDASRVTASDMAKALRAARGRAPIRELMKPIKMLDDRRKAIPNHPVKVDAKTGTLNFVSSLAGYATAEDGRELAFAIFVADTRRRNAIKRADRERPAGGRSYNRAAKALQQKLLQRWGRIYTAS
ncbi:D-alanyl-D-alanine carboxypeptidase/D-alanyl-D-alanine endopeptidase [Roseobacteraceae bacterium S113]